MSGTPGLIVPPYPVEKCAGEHCRRELNEDGLRVFLFAGGAKMYCLCEECSDEIQLNPDASIRLVAL